MISIEKLTVGPFQENTYLLYDHTGEGIVVDPGMSNSQEEQMFRDMVASKNIDLKLIVNTHCHIDHVMGNAFCVSEYRVPLLIPSGEKVVLDQALVAADLYHISYNQSPEPDKWFEPGFILEFGDSELQTAYTPGHSPGHVILVHEIERFIIGGDVLFRDSVGRVDLPGGDGPTLVESIRKEIFTLPDDFMVYPGHGPSTQVGYERENNPFVGKNASGFF